MKIWELYRSRLLFELDVPDTTYGYWITDTGEYISVGFQKHKDVAVQLIKRAGESSYTQGWIAVIVPHTYSYSTVVGKRTSTEFDAAWGPNVSNKSLMALMKLIRDYSDIAELFVIKVDHTRDSRTAMKIVRDQIQEQNNA